MPIFPHRTMRVPTDPISTIQFAPYYSFIRTAFTAPHDPLQAPDEWIKRFKGQYEQGYAEVQSCLGFVLGAVDLLAVSPEISSFILELYSIIDQASADYNRRTGFNNQIETLHGKSSAA